MEENEYDSGMIILNIDYAALHYYHLFVMLISIYRKFNYLKCTPTWLVIN